MDRAQTWFTGRSASLLVIPAIILWSVVATAETVTIMSFNAQNLFDITDDPANPGDDTYLPLLAKEANRDAHDLNCESYYGGYVSFVEQCKYLDWNDTVYATKLQRLADVIEAATPLPDVIVFQEVENKNVLDDLVRRHPSIGGYQVIQLDTTNRINNRGLDVGILTRLPVAGEPEAHRITFAGDKELCSTIHDILHVPLRLPEGEILHVFGVHFSPRGSQFPCRIIAFERLNDLAAALPPGSMIVAAGDFNINCVESRTAAVIHLFESGDWHVSPIVRQGCKVPGSFRGVSASGEGNDTWSFLDMILVSGSLSPNVSSASNWVADLDSFGTVVVDSEQIQVDDDGQGNAAPRWFDPVSGRGVSDHWPVAIRLMAPRG